MISGTTKSGFDYEISEDVLDDYELLEMLSEVDRGNVSLLTTAAGLILGEEQIKKLKEHNRGDNGIVSAKRMIKDIVDIITKKEIKNS